MAVRIAIVLLFVYNQMVCSLRVTINSNFHKAKGIINGFYCKGKKYSILHYQPVAKAEALFFGIVIF